MVTAVTPRLRTGHPGSWTQSSTRRHPHPFFFFHDHATTEIYTLSLHDALPISTQRATTSASPPPDHGRTAHPARSCARRWASWSRAAAKRIQTALRQPGQTADGAPARTLAWFERQLNSRKAEPVTDDRTTLAMLSEQLADAVATAGAALVAVHARPRLPSTGVHWNDGVVVTTEGTIRREDDIAVTLPDGRRIPATLAGRDRGTDLAVRRIASASLPVATLGDPATLRPGHLVLALARLDEGGPRAAFGAESATGGKWRCWKGGEIDSWLQSDLDIYPGFGGGPLVDATGRIHGVNSGGLSRTLATTIPVATVNRVMTQLLERGYVARGWIGAAMQPVRLDPATQQRLKREAGLLLLSVEPDAPASRAELLVGDIVVAIDDKDVDGFDQLLDVLGGDVVVK